MIVPGGTRRAGPYEISETWLRHGEIWCLLDWHGPDTASGTGYFAARALCGEDAARPYALGLHLDGERLTLIWDEQTVAGPLRRCGGD